MDSVLLCFGRVYGLMLCFYDMIFYCPVLLGGGATAATAPLPLGYAIDYLTNFCQQRAPVGI